MSLMELDSANIILLPNGVWKHGRKCLTSLRRSCSSSWYLTSLRRLNFRTSRSRTSFWFLAILCDSVASISLKFSLCWLSTASLCRLGVSTSAISRFHRSFFSLYSCFILFSKLLRSALCCSDTSFISFFSVLMLFFKHFPSSSWCLVCNGKKERKINLKKKREIFLSASDEICQSTRKKKSWKHFVQNVIKRKL